MLQQLSIKNFALIQDIDVRFDRRLNIITGETGAGKSMLLGALGLILGQRADMQIIGRKGDKCSIEGVFDLRGLDLQEFFIQNDLDYADDTVLRRELNTAGKSRSFINDTPVSLQQLKELASSLVSFHSQHENLSLGNMDFQFMVVDNYAGNAENIVRFREVKRRFNILQNEIGRIEQEIAGQSKDEDYRRFLLEELIEAQLKPGEDIELEAIQIRLANAGRLQEGLAQSIALLETDESGLLDQLRRLDATIESLVKFEPALENLHQSLKSQVADFRQMARDLGNAFESVAIDDERLAEINARLQLIYNLQRKHKTASLDELLAIQSELQNSILGGDNLAMKLEELKKEQLSILSELQNLAEVLHQKRVEILDSLQNEINETLAKVGMPHALLKAELSELPDGGFNNFGRHGLRFLFAPNPGSPFLPLEKIASGGELSRIMLVIKNLIAGVQRLPVLVFDEIDTGISGETALKVGRLMHGMARRHQLICITHLPQIACYADEQFHIMKKVKNDSTATFMINLDQAARERELARMIGGDSFSERALDNARELMVLGERSQN